MFKLLGGELKKIFLKPIIYIMAIILGVTLGLSLLIYEPEIRTNSSTGLSLEGLTVEDVKLSFENKKVEINAQFDQLKQSINDFTIKNENERLTQYVNENKKSIDKLSKEFNEILFLGQAHYGSEAILKVNLKNKLTELNKAFSNLKTIYTEISSSTLPHVLITKSNNEQITSTLEDAINATTNPTIDLSLDGYKAIGEALEVNNYADNLNQCFNKLTNCFIEAEVANNLIDKYCSNEYYDRQNTLYLELSKAKNKNDVLDVYKKYYSNFNTINKICYGEIYKSIANSVSDNTLQSLINTNTLNSKLGLLEKSINENFINETTSTYKYLWSNNYYDFDFGYSSNSAITVGNDISAIDFSLYGMQLTSFVVILMCVIISATSISSEINNKTIKTIAVKPISRTSIITAKLLATLIIGVLFMVFSSILSFAIGAISYGYSSQPIVATLIGKYAFKLSPIPYLLIYLVSAILKLFVYISLAMMLSVLTSSNIPALITSLLVFFAGSVLFSLFPTSNILAYLPFINLDLFVFFGGCIPPTGLFTALFTPGFLNNNQIWITLTYLISLPLILNLISIITFNKRDIV